MEDVIKVYDDEVFEEFEQEENTESSESEYHSYKKSNTTLGDIMLLQCILCVLVIIALAVLNLVKPEMTNDLLFEFKQNLDKPFEYKTEFSQIISKIIGLF